MTRGQPIPSAASAEDIRCPLPPNSLSLYLLQLLQASFGLRFDLGVGLFLELRDFVLQPADRDVLGPPEPNKQSRVIVVCTTSPGKLA